ncbi:MULTISPECIES: LysR substrate-binding domain-containing protein [unclassified Bradyrhizobium]|uniref:LysR substrate-binding domain-containing protein n=1 Tax=unclassified Bradyrhizobium TaxID=2631580 RepID=UPI0018CDD862|nr:MULTISPECIES: LysR substrate-binding domain-containing protein [unclassified Bradyrhizobium]
MTSQVLRVAADSILVSRIIIPRLQTFRSKFPFLSIQVSTEERCRGLGEADVAVCLGSPSNSEMSARSMGSWPLTMAGAPNYLQTYGVPRVPTDLSSHHFVGGDIPKDVRLTLTKRGRNLSVRLAGPLTVTDTESALAAGIGGMGLVISAQPILRHDIKEGRLISVLASWDIGVIEAHVLVQEALSPEAEAFVEFLVDTMTEH